MRLLAALQARQAVCAVLRVRGAASGTVGPQLEVLS